MSIEQSKVIDSLSDSKTDDSCVLRISDHLEWNNREHLIALQDKLNNYLAFIESNEIYKVRPHAVDQAIEICLYCKFTPDEADDIRFLQLARDTIQKAGFGFSLIIDNKVFKIPKTEE